MSFFHYWVGPVPYLELFWAGPATKNTLYNICIASLTADTLPEQPLPMLSVCKQSLDDSESEREYGAHRVGRLHLQSAARLHSNQTARVWPESGQSLAARQCLQACLAQTLCLVFSLDTTVQSSHSSKTADIFHDDCPHNFRPVCFFIRIF